jgi:adenylosuccinate lyase
MIPFESSLLRELVSTPRMREVWTEEAMLEQWMKVERALTGAQADLGMIPRAAADEICTALTLERIDRERLARRRESVGHLMVSFIEEFREACGPAAEHFHIGATTQDILDTGLTLQMRDAEEVITAQMLELEEALCDRALEHRDTLLMGRTHQQHAVPLTFGFVLATWAAEVCDQIDRAREARARWLLGAVSGAVGARNAYVELADEASAAKLEEQACALLGLGVPRAALHSRTDRFAEVLANLASLATSLGRFCLDLRAMQRSEVMEVEEPWSPEGQWSSTMPNKRNPEVTEHVDGIAKLVRGLALALGEVEVADTRDGTRLPVEFVSIPLAYALASRALATTTAIISGLIVHSDRMRANLDHPNVGGGAAAERIMIALYRETGEKERARAILGRCCKRADRDRIPLREALLEEPGISDHLEPREIDRLLDLTTYAGSSRAQTEQTVAAVRQRRERAAAAER